LYELHLIDILRPANELCDDEHMVLLVLLLTLTMVSLMIRTGLSNKSNQEDLEFFDRAVENMMMVYDRGCRWVLLMLLPTLTMVSLVGYMAVKDYRYTCWYLLLFLKLADTCFFLLKLADTCFFLLKLATTSSLMVLLLSCKCVSDEAC
ncbi:hypothetical protein Tco_0606906, partial [Tanacetum coccineum]